MADLDYYGADYGAEEPSRLGDAVRNFGIANWAGAITSLGLTAGLAVWAVDLTMRDVSTVPVIAALEGPMREAPADPGGRVAPFQGLALSDITSGGPATPAPEQIVLAPPPVSLDASALSDRIAAAATETNARQAEAAPATAERSMADSIQMVLSEAVEEDLLVEPGMLPEIDVAQLANELVAGDAVADETTTADETLADGRPGVSRSVRPRARPASLRQPIAATPVVPTDAPDLGAGTQVASLEASLPTSRDADPATLVPGTRVVQLGAYDSESIARAEWDRLEGRFGTYMHGKDRLVQQATSGGRDFWRLRVVGFEDGGAARRFCSELLANNAPCIPLTIR